MFNAIQVMFNAIQGVFAIFGVFTANIFSSRQPFIVMNVYDAVVIHSYSCVLYYTLLMYCCVIMLICIICYIFDFFGYYWFLFCVSRSSSFCLGFHVKMKLHISL